jgi:hypothetical protein
VRVLDTPGYPLIELPDVTAVAFSEFLNCLQTGLVTPATKHPRDWISFYAPFAPEDVAVEIAELGHRFSSNDVFNGAIYMMSIIAKNDLWSCN